MHSCAAAMGAPQSCDRGLQRTVDVIMPPMRRVFRSSILTLLLTLSAGMPWRHSVEPLQAQGTRAQIDVSKLGPQVGERVPDFRLFDQAGKERTLQSIMGRRGAMLVFVRSANW